MNAKPKKDDLLITNPYYGRATPTMVGRKLLKYQEPKPKGED